METTERLSLPLLMAGQAQKEVFHNEALQLLDIAVAAAVEQLPQDDLPTGPSFGSSYLVGTNPGGDWAGRAEHLAAYTSAGWRFMAPLAGMTVFVKSAGVFAVYGSQGWEAGQIRGSRLVIEGQQVVGPRTATISEATGGATVDVEARAALAQILSALRQHGLISV